MTDTLTSTAPTSTAPTSTAPRRLNITLSLRSATLWLSLLASGAACHALAQTSPAPSAEQVQAWPALSEWAPKGGQGQAGQWTDLRDIAQQRRAERDASRGHWRPPTGTTSEIPEQLAAYQSGAQQAWLGNPVHRRAAEILVEVSAAPAHPAEAASPLSPIGRSEPQGAYVAPLTSAPLEPLDWILITLFGLLCSVLVAAGLWSTWDRPWRGLRPEPATHHKPTTILSQRLLD